MTGQPILQSDADIMAGRLRTPIGDLRVCTILDIPNADAATNRSSPRSSTVSTHVRLEPVTVTSVSQP